jgi:hypothetical protein
VQQKIQCFVLLSMERTDYIHVSRIPLEPTLRQISSIHIFTIYVTAYPAMYIIHGGDVFFFLKYDRRSADDKLPPNLCLPEFHDFPPLDPKPKHLNSVHSAPASFTKICFNIVLPFAHIVSKPFRISGFSTYISLLLSAPFVLHFLLFHPF